MSNIITNKFFLKGIVYHKKFESRQDLTILKFSIGAYSHTDKQTKEIKYDFIPITVYNNQAEYMNELIEDHDTVLVVGKISQNNYVDKFGNKVYSFSFTCNEGYKLANKNNEKNEKNQQLLFDENISNISEPVFDIPIGVDNVSG